MPTPRLFALGALAAAALLAGCASGLRYTPPAAAPVTPVPTLSQWMLLALSGLLGLLAWRRRAA